MDYEEISLISDATKRNWARLGADEKNKLTARANKRMSDKRIVPKEYIICSDTLPLIEELSQVVHERGWSIAAVMKSLCIVRLKACELWGKEGVQRAFSDVGEVDIIEELLNIALPYGEWDILGLIYQSLLTEGKKNQMGAYYTPPSVVRDMLADVVYSDEQSFFEPCCGSGSFLLGMVRMGIPPKQIFACDIDAIAVMIAKTNLLCECGAGEWVSHIVCGDFLKDNLFSAKRWDYVFTNPPWGAMRKGESFSSFLHKCCEMLKEDGAIRFLLPDSFLNIRAHRAIRRYLLEKECIAQIRLYKEAFSGVTTGCICVEVRHHGEKGIHIIGRGMDEYLWAEEILRDEDCTFLLVDDIDKSIFQKVYAHGKYTLKESLWAIGIVTGDNQRHLKEQADAGYEPIYTGKEVFPYWLGEPRYYIRYDRTAFQQSAKEENYRVKEKLIYKFISNRLVFALDTNGTLCLNSANVLIPRIEGLSIRAVMALLNSMLYQYLYRKQFCDVKILKGNLQKLPFPKLSEAENEAIDTMVRAIMNGNKAENEVLQTYIFELFELTQDEITRIFECTKG